MRSPRREATPVAINSEIAELIELCTKKLASSGISKERAETLGMKPMPAKTIKSMGYWKAWGGMPALLIPYLDPFSGELVRRNNVDMHRVRCLREPPAPPKDFPKYLQPAKTGAVAYFPMVDTIDWPKVLNDPTAPLIITEGELKATCAALRGFTTLAIGGVWNFRKGEALLPELLQIKWTDRTAFIAFDSDAAVKPQIREAMRLLANLLIEQGAKVFRVVLPNEGEKTGLDDLLLADDGPAVLSRLLETAEVMDLVPDLPVIQVVAGELNRVATEAENALIASNAPIYQRGVSLVRPRYFEVQRKDGGVALQGGLGSMTTPATVDVLCGVSEFKRWDARAGRLVTIDPPTKVVDILLSRAGHWRLPPIDGVITAPTLRPDGSVITAAGYDPATHLYHLADPSLRVPPIPERPTKAEAEAALESLQELLDEFPFETDTDRAVVLAGILTLVARGMFDVVPGFVFSASTPGSGKSYLTDLIAAIGTGQVAPSMNGEDHNEMVKHLVAKVIQGAPLISIDNVNGALWGAFLCQLIERRRITVRPLGESRDIEMEARITFFANGNGITLRGDLVRRCLKATIDAEVERPELREFKKNPMAMVMSDRGAYLAAAMTVVRAYLAAGKPDAAKPQLGSFEDWSDVIRSSLIWLGCADVVGSIEAARDDDDELEAKHQFFATVPDFLLNTEVDTKTIVTTARSRSPTTGDELGEMMWPEFHAAVLAVAGERGTIDSSKLGYWLKAQRNAVFGDRRLKAVTADKDTKHHGSRKWIIEANGPPRPVAVVAAPPRSTTRRVKY
jgi:putative DNA primase/helicase